MRDALLAYGVHTPIEVLPTGLPAESSGPRRRRDLPPQVRSAGRPAAAAVRRPRRLREEHRFPAAHVREAARAAPGCIVRHRRRRPRARTPDEARARARRQSSRRASSAISTAARICRIVMRRVMRSCSPRARKHRAWCCSRRWRRARPWFRPRSSVRARSSRPRCGAFVVPEEEQAFAAAVVIRAGARSPAIRAARNCALTRNSWASQAMARRLIAFYEKILLGAKLPLSPPGRRPLRTPLGVERSS